MNEIAGPGTVALGIFVLGGPYWGEAFLKTGVSLDGMMELIKDWLGRHTEEKAMRIGGDLVTTFGRRRHVAILNSHLAAQSI